MACSLLISIFSFSAKDMLKIERLYDNAQGSSVPLTVDRRPVNKPTEEHTHGIWRIHSRPATRLSPILAAGDPSRGGADGSGRGRGLRHRLVRRASLQQLQP